MPRKKKLPPYSSDLRSRVLAGAGKLSVRELGREVGISSSSAWRIMNGLGRPGANVIDKLEEWLRRVGK